ncbi:MAG: alpha/beta hydrolase [Acidobacteria bacterium]|nr:alpha/beta hydrolase [Acidobacteriota bacterium]
MQRRRAIVVAVLALAGCAPGQPGLENGSFTMTVGDRQIHYEVHGRGPVLMALTNSWGLDLQPLRAMYRPLEERLTLVYFDPRGIGGSSPARADADRGPGAVRADFEALRQHLGLARVNAIGWSNGAQNLIILAAEHPGSLAKAIFVHGVASSTDEDGRVIAERHPDLARRYAVVNGELQALPTAQARTARLKTFFIEEMLPEATAEPAAARPMLRELFEKAQFSWEHYVETQREFQQFDERRRLAAITVPALVIAGAHDLAPLDRSREFQAGMPDAKLVVFENSGHFAPKEEPDRFKATVFEFLGVADGTPGEER